MLKKLSLLMMVSAMALALAACSGINNTKNNNGKNTDSEEKIKIIASIFPVKEFAEAVGGDRVKVSLLVPEGVEAHDFEPKPRDIESLAGADIFAYNGLGMEAWINQVLQTVSSKKNLTIVNTSTGAEVLYYDEDNGQDYQEEDHDHAEEEHDHEEEDHKHGEYDPHIWLSLKEAKVQAENIKNALVSIDEENKDYYEANFDTFASELNALESEYKEKFDALANKYFITGHSAFGYLCRDFGLTQVGISGLRAEGEPTAQALKQLIEFAKNNEIKVIFMEELASPKVSETIANEVQAEVQKIYSIENGEDGKGYLEMMKENLQRIYSSLE